MKFSTALSIFSVIPQSAVCFLLGNSPASEFYIPTFRNTSIFICGYLSAYKYGTVLRNVGIQNSDAGELPRRKHTTFRTRRKFEIKNPQSVLESRLVWPSDTIFIQMLV